MTDQGIQIRQASVGDAAEIHGVLLAARCDIPINGPFEGEETRAYLEGRCRAKEGWIAELDGSVAGVMLLGLSMWRQPYVSEISYLVTKNEFRRQNVGRRLVRHAVKTFAEQDSPGIVVEVWEKNQPTISLLRNEGFIPHPTRQKPRPQRQDPRPYFVTYFRGDVL